MKEDKVITNVLSNEDKEYLKTKIISEIHDISKKIKKYRYKLIKSKQTLTNLEWELFNLNKN